MGHPLERVNNKIGDCTFFSNATFGQVGGLFILVFHDEFASTVYMK